MVTSCATCSELPSSMTTMLGTNCIFPRCWPKVKCIHIYAQFTFTLTLTAHFLSGINMDFYWIVIFTARSLLFKPGNSGPCKIQQHTVHNVVMGLPLWSLKTRCAHVKDKSLLKFGSCRYAQCLKQIKLSIWHHTRTPISTKFLPSDEWSIKLRKMNNAGILLVLLWRGTTRNQMWISRQNYVWMFSKRFERKFVPYCIY